MAIAKADTIASSMNISTGFNFMAGSPWLKIVALSKD
jgi:hypothetical protein